MHNEPGAAIDLSTQANGLLSANLDANFDMSDSALVDASMFGGDTSFGFTGGNTNTASTKAEEDITTPADDSRRATDLHPFSIGGHSMRFSQLTRATSDSSGPNRTFEIEDEVANSANFELLLFGVMGEISGGVVAKSISKKWRHGRGRNMAIWKSHVHVGDLVVRQVCDTR